MAPQAPGPSLPEPETLGNGICFSGQRPSTGTGKVIQRLRREKRNKIA